MGLFKQIYQKTNCLSVFWRETHLKSRFGHTSRLNRSSNRNIGSESKKGRILTQMTCSGADCHRRMRS